MSILALASGSGSNFQALLDDARIRESLVGLICNRPGAGCLTRAEAAQVPHHLIDHRSFADR